MNFDLLSCTFEKLNSLKFNELKKLSSEFRVNKRWAKKKEIIQKLLDLRDKEIEKRGLSNNSSNDISEEDNTQWVDGSKAFSESKENVQGQENERRLTYSVIRSVPEDADRRLTFNVVKENLLNIENHVIDCTENFDRRLTYITSNDKCNGKEVANSFISRIEEKKNLQNSVLKKENSTDIQSKHIINVKSLTTENVGALMSDSKKACDDEIREICRSLDKNASIGNLSRPRESIGKSIKAEAKPSRVKKLTVPCAKIQRTVNMKTSEGDSNYKLKGSEISADSEGLDITSDSNEKDMLYEKEKGAGQQSLKELHCTSVKVSKEMNYESNKRVLGRKSKTQDTVFVKNLRSPQILKFYSSKVPHMADIELQSETDDGIKCRIPIAACSPTVSERAHKKIITAKKMPDFSRIHQKRFEKMDSLLDYKRKKEERVKRLFGVPQPGIPSKVEKKDISKVIRFKSCHDEKENELNKSIPVLKKTVPFNNGDENKKSIVKNISRKTGKPNIIMNVKEENRKLLNGVRTNKRFELQMKFRNL